MSDQTESAPTRVESGTFGPRKMAEETGVYRIFNADGVLLYVGMSVSPETRFADHRTCKSWMQEAHRYETRWYGTREEAEQEEQRAIRIEQPRHNSVHRALRRREVVPSRPGAYTVAEIAERFSLSTTSVRARAKLPTFPEPERGGESLTGRVTRYPTDAVEAFFTAAGE